MYERCMGSPVIRVFGGVHDDAGSRERFRREFASRVSVHGRPSLVAVEHDAHLFQLHAAQRPEIARCLLERWEFLSEHDAQEIAASYFWEGDAHRDLVGGPYRWMFLDRFWEHAKARLEHQVKCGFHGWKSIEDNFVEIAQIQVDRLCNPSLPSRKELRDNSGIPPTIPEPRSRDELVARISKKAWDDARQPEPNDDSRDTRWVRGIEEALRGVEGGWIGVTVGWRHADSVEAGNLRAQLLARGHEIEVIKLAPEPRTSSTAASK